MSQSRGLSPIGVSSLAQELIQEWRQSPLIWGSAVVVGAGIAYFPLLTLMSALAVCLVAFALYRGHTAWWDAFVAAMVGSLALTYGFANIGIFDLPIADLFLILLLMRARARFVAPFLPGAIFIGWAAIRLYWDYPEFGILALRDFTLPLEMLWAVVGFWMMSYGRERWIRSFRWIFLAVLLHAFALQWEGLGGFGPVVGFDKAVGLFGHGAGLDVALAAGGFFYLLLKPFRRLSYILSALCFAMVLIFQTRGLYVLVPAVFLLLWLLASNSRFRLLGTVLLGILAVFLMFSLVPQGRLAPSTPTFYVEHFQTLLGEEGPGSANIHIRQEWAKLALDKVQAQPWGWLRGVGLGTDLISGFSITGGELVRKPHNDYLETFARYGMIGFLPFAGALGLALIQLVLGARRNGDPFLWWVIATAVLYLGEAAIQPMLSFPFGTMPLFACLGAGLALLNHFPRTVTPNIRPDRSRDGIPLS